MKEATLSSKNQIVVPREARDALRIRAGDRLLITVMGSTVILLPRPTKYSQALKGAGKDLYPAGYLKKERASWK